VCPFVPTVKLFAVTCEYIKGEKQFYNIAQQFYEDVTASEEGMLGDYVEICNVDLEGSRNFLKRFVVSHAIPTHIPVQIKASSLSGNFIRFHLRSRWSIIYTLHCGFSTVHQYIDVHGYSYPCIYMSESIWGEEFIFLTS